MNGVNLEFCIQSKLTRLNLYSFLSINVLCEISLLCGSDQGGFYFQLEKQQKDLWPLVPKYDSWIEDWTFLSPSVSPTIVNSYIFLNRSVVDLQGINTYCTAKWYSNTHTHTHILFHYSLSQDISPFHREYSSLWYTVGLCCLFILYVIVCICWPQPPNPSLPNAPPTLTTTGLFSMSVVNSHVFKSHSGLTSDCDCRDKPGWLPSFEHLKFTSLGLHILQVEKPYFMSMISVSEYEKVEPKMNQPSTVAEIGFFHKGLSVFK